MNKFDWASRVQSIEELKPMGFRLILNEHGVAWGADGSGVSGGVEVNWRGIGSRLRLHWGWAGGQWVLRCVQVSFK